MIATAGHSCLAAMFINLGMWQAPSRSGVIRVGSRQVDERLSHRKSEFPKYRSGSAGLSGEPSCRARRLPESRLSDLRTGGRAAALPPPESQARPGRTSRRRSSDPSIVATALIERSSAAGWRRPQDIGVARRRSAPFAQAAANSGIASWRTMGHSPQWLRPRRGAKLFSASSLAVGNESSGDFGGLPIPLKRWDTACIS